MRETKALRLLLRASLSLLLVAGLLFVPVAGAASPAPGWTLDSQAIPSNFSAADNSRCASGGRSVGNCDGYQVTLTNAGSVPTSGPFTLTDTVPAGLEVHQISLFWYGPGARAFTQASGIPTGNGFDFGGALCEEPSTNTVSCTFPGVLSSAFEVGSLQPDDSLEMFVLVEVKDPSASGSLTNAASVSGGGPPSLSVSAQNTVGESAPKFGFERFTNLALGPDGRPDTQAGDHPYELTTRIDLNNEFRQPPDSSERNVTSVEDPKDIVVDLPLGFVGSTLAAPTCSLALLSVHGSVGGTSGGCPADTIVGSIKVAEPNDLADSIEGPVYNLVPEKGAAAEFGFVDLTNGVHVLYASVAPTPEGYVLRTSSPDITEIGMHDITVTFFGNPAVKDGSGKAQIPFFTDPSDCSGAPPTTRVYMDSWQHPGRYNADGTPAVEDPAGGWVSAQSQAPPTIGCNLLQFSPSLVAQPTTSTADSPTGLEFELKQPQPEVFGTSATPDLKNATVVFPAGMTVDPSSGTGLEACSAAQIGWQGGTAFNFNDAAPVCPEASKIGSLELETPLIPGVLTGQIYLASPNENPFGSVFGIYVVVNDPTTGVVLKIAGELKSEPGTGRLTGFFPENAQLPFSDLKLHFFGGPRAELATPESCGSFQTTSDLQPWSAPDSGPDAEPSAGFQIDEGCVNGFSPSFTAGSTNLQAGAFTSFVASFSRQDADQEMGGLSLTLPPGLLANVGSVPECGEAEIAAARAGTGGCPEDTKVGDVTAFAGPGPNPLRANGTAYLTGPYNGGPYGLAVVVPAVAGPFHFGNVVVRQSLRIDPYTAQVTDVSDTFPTFLDPKGANGQTNGVPIKLKRIDVAIDRPQFTFNGTSCEHLTVTGTLTSVGNLNSSLSSPFQVTNCSTLKFEPKFSVSTSGKTSKADGASLTARLSYPNTPQGAQANIGLVKVELPEQLPSRLTTLQQACTNAQFEANPAECPAASKIGYAVVHTPLLAVPLTGPAIFVSHGGEAFPSLTMVLQGAGVTVDLVGTTFISKAGVTSTTFKTVPDTPFSTFELTLPEGPYSALTAIGSLCASNLVMPTEFIAQNGVKLTQSTPVEVEDCHNTLAVVSSHVKKRTLKLTVRAPGAGRITISGKGLTSSSKSYARAETQTFVLHQKKAGRLRTKIKLTYTPTTGKERTKQVKNLTVKFTK